MIDGFQGKLAVVHQGQGGLPVLFLHADVGRASQWETVMRGVAAKRETIAFDFRGHGGSEPAANGDYSYDGRAEDIGVVADARALARFVIVAHSGSNGAALAYASRNGGRVAGILMVDPATDPRQLPPEVRAGFAKDLAGPHSLEVVKGYYASIAGANPQTQQRVLLDAESVDPAARSGVGKALADWNPEPTLNAYRGPIRVLVSTANDNAAALYRLRNDIPFEIVADAGHWLQLDQPERVADAVEAFVRGIEEEDEGE